MQRRHFLTSSLAAAAAALTPSESQAQAPASKAREYYELRKYEQRSGPQTKLLQSYLADALIPALNRLGFSPIGAFTLDIGPETPTQYLLIPSSTVESLVTAELQLAKDEEFMKAAAPCWNAPASAPAFARDRKFAHDRVRRLAEVGRSTGDGAARQASLSVAHLRKPYPAGPCP